MKKSTKETKSEITSMADLLAKMGGSVKTFTTGQRVKAKVLFKNPASLILDIGGKSEGIVKEKGFTDAREFIEKLQVGDEVLATVLVPETRDGTIILALRDALQDAIWEKLNKAKKENAEVAVYGKELGSAGLIVSVEGLEGFIPMSQLGKEVSENPEQLVGKYFKVKVVELDKEHNKVVLSEKEVSDASDLKLAREAQKEIKEGEVYEGVVTTVANFGVFVKFKVKKAELEGLVHVSEISYKKTANPSDVLSVGDKVKVRVLTSREGRLALSIRQAGENPWSKVEGKYKVESKITGKVVKISDFGVFVELEPGVEGLIHITKIPPTKKYQVGEEASCTIDEVNIKDKRISLTPVLTSIPLGYK